MLINMAAKNDIDDFVCELSIKSDDDVFYDELRRQILLLTEDDDIDDGNDFVTAKQGPKRSSARAIKPVGNYFNWWEANQNGNSAPIWLLNLWRNGNINRNGETGTGVFIPQIVKSRKFRSSGKKRNNGRRMMYKQIENSELF